MPRRTAANNQAKEPRRSLRRSSRLQSEEDALRSAHTQATPTASAVAPSGNQDTASSSAVAPSDNRGSSPLGHSALEEKSNLTLRARGRKRDHSDSDRSTSASRKKGRSSTARVSLDPNDTSMQREAPSPNVNVKYASTITPVNSVQTRSRTDEDEEEVSVGQPKANLLGNDNDGESSRLSTTSSTTSSVRSQRQALPECVVDLYPSNQDASKRGTCKQSYCASKSLTEAFLSSYGYEYYQALKGQEQHDDDASSASSNRTFSTAESNSPSPLTETPRRHRAALSHNRPVLGSSPLVGEFECLDRQPYLTPKMRGILIDWLIELSEEYRFTPMTLQLAVALVDKSLACGAPTLSQAEGSGFFTVKREMLQCVGCACMWIASKCEEIEPPCALDFVYISDNSYSKEQIADMELTVCTALEFRLSQVTPLHFISEFLRASCACGDPSCSAAENPLLKHMVLYLLELSLLPNELAYTNASLKAAAAVYVARVTLGIRSGGEAAVGSNGYWSRTLEHYTGYDLGDLEETVLTIHRYHRAAEESQLKSVFVKYRSEKYNSVSLKTVPLESDLGF